MSDLGWFAAFFAIALLMIGVSGWMAWYSRRAMKSHKDQIDGMIREMRELIEDTDEDLPPNGS